MGLEININKTKVITFCPSRHNPLFETFLLGDTPIKHTDKYCYLGITFHRNGSFSTANNELRAKALRALYGLKNSIIKDSLSHHAKNTLFDTLIKPILLYGCQVITPHSNTMNYISRLNDQSNPENTLKYIARDHYEKFHLKYIKWSLSVHSKTSNIGCWGETGRHPLFYEACKLAIDYYTRVENSDNVLLAATFHEQATLGLPWHSNISKILEKYNKSPNANPKAKLSSQIVSHMREEFVKNWKLAKESSPKLEFYSKIKNSFEPENYLSVIKLPDIRKSLTRFRISCHNLYIERGRYETPLVPREDRWCTYCYNTTGLKPIEDEAHVLTSCPLYSSIKAKHKFSPATLTDLTGSLSNVKICPNELFNIAKTIHIILSVNEKYTAYYKSPDFHNNTGNCILL